MQLLTGKTGQGRLLFPSSGKFLGLFFLGLIVLRLVILTGWAKKGLTCFVFFFWYVVLSFLLLLVLGFSIISITCKV